MLRKTLSDYMQYTLQHAARVEPLARVHDVEHRARGTRHLPECPKQHVHRFAIKGGVSITSLIAQNIQQNNSLLKRMIERAY